MHVCVYSSIYVSEIEETGTTNDIRPIVYITGLEQDDGAREARELSVANSYRENSTSCV